MHNNEDIWSDVSRILVNSKYRLPVAKNDVAVFVIDVRKSLSLIKEKYDLLEKGTSNKAEFLDWVAREGYKPDRCVDGVNYWMKFRNGSQMPCGTTIDLVQKFETLYKIENEKRKNVTKDYAE